jgi:hypothetical protein
MFGWIDGDTLAKCDQLAGVSGDAFSWNDDTDEIQWVGSGNGGEIAGGLLIALGTQ